MHQQIQSEVKIMLMHLVRGFAPAYIQTSGKPRMKQKLAPRATENFRKHERDRKNYRNERPEEGSHIPTRKLSGESSWLERGVGEQQRLLSPQIVKHEHPSNS